MAILERTAPHTPYFSETLNGSFNTAAVDCEDYRAGAVHLVWSGVDATDGIAGLEVSNDGSNWNLLGGTSAETTLNSAADSQVWIIPDITFERIRLKYTHGTGTTGTGQIYFSLRAE